MQRGALVTERVEYIDNDLIPDIGYNGWNGPLSIDSNHRSIKDTVWVGRDPADLKVICDGGRVHPSKEGCEKRELKETRHGCESHCGQMASSCQWRGRCVRVWLFL